MLYGYYIIAHATRISKDKERKNEYIKRHTLCDDYNMLYFLSSNNIPFILTIK